MAKSLNNSLITISFLVICTLSNLPSVFAFILGTLLVIGIVAFLVWFFKLVFQGFCGLCKDNKPRYCLIESNNSVYESSNFEAKENHPQENIESISEQDVAIEENELVFEENNDESEIETEGFESFDMIQDSPFQEWDFKDLLTHSRINFPISTATGSIAKGLKAFKKEQYVKAVEYFTAAFNDALITVAEDSIYVFRGITYSNLGLDKDAIKDFNTAIKMYYYENPVAFLERGKIYFRQENYKKALSDFNQAISTDLSFNGDGYFYRALLFLKINKSENAIKDLEFVIKNSNIKNSKMIDHCKTLLEKIENNDNLERIKDATKGFSEENSFEINLESCSQYEIKSLAGFNDEKAEIFIEQRNSGMMWYDLDSFILSFNIQPHEMIAIQDRIVFPPKPTAKIGRRKLDI